MYLERFTRNAGFALAALAIVATMLRELAR